MSSTSDETLDIIVNLLTIAMPVLMLLLTISTFQSVLNVTRNPLRAVVIPVFSSALLAAMFAYLPTLVEDLTNHSREPVLPIYHSYAQDCPERVDVTDLHCDALLWGGRDLLEIKTHPFISNRPVGMVDLPRLKIGRVRTQVFAAVNSAVRKLNYDKNPRPSVIGDILVLKAIFERWPVRTWFSPKQRVIYQFHRLHGLSKRSDGDIEVIRTRDQYVKTTASVRAILAVEGLGCLEHNITSVDEFFDTGIRILGPTHFFDTEVGGSKSGECNCGLSQFGREVMNRMKALSMIVDFAHASDALMDDILNLPEDERPTLMISHTGLQSVCKSNRNLDDDMMVRIRDAGGLIGISLFDPALCGNDLIGSFVRTVVHAANVLEGVNALALGSDWDGKVKTAVSAADTHLLSAALQKAGNFSLSDVKKIMHENADEFFKQSLPV